MNIFPPQTEQDRLDDISHAQKLAEFIRSKLGVRSRGKGSVALVDWSAVNRTYNLLRGEPDFDYHYDPFIALRDFSTIVSACIFYDRVIFIDDGRLAHNINSAMNLDKVFVPLSIKEAGSPLELSLDAHYSWAFNHFDKETWENAQWLSWQKCKTMSLWMLGSKKALALSCEATII